MSKYRSLWKWLLFLAVCAGIIWLVLHFTAHYPSLGEPVDYQVNDIPGIELTLENQKWLPFTGYSFRWHVDVDTATSYSYNFQKEYLEHHVDGQWYRLNQERRLPPGDNSTEIGGSESPMTLESSMTQDYAGYGNRLEPGLYRFTLELTDTDGAPHYIAAEFTVK